MYAKLDASLASLSVQEDHRCANTLLIGVYVDDMIITSTSINDITKFKEHMRRVFDMSDLGLLSYYLGIEVRHQGGEITLCQSTYAMKILDASGMRGCHASDTSM